MDLNLYVLITIACWGIWGIFDKLALKGASYRDVVLIFYILFAPQAAIVFFLLNWLHPGWQLSMELLQWTGLAALTYTVAMIAYIQAMSKTEASYVLGITASYPLILQFLAVALLGENLVASRLAGAALIGLGVFAIGASTDRKGLCLPARDRTSMIICVIIATLCWGIWGIFDKKAVSVAHPLAVYFAQCLWDMFYLVVLYVVFRLQGHKANFSNPSTWKFAALSGFSLMLGAWTFLSALACSSASYVIVITGCYPLLMYLFALWLLKERFNRVRLSGIALVVAGGILVQLTQSL